MAFERSASGQENRGLFYNVDRIVYVEGGRSDKGPLESMDIPFWRGIFRILRPDLQVRFIPKGGKPILKELANDIISNHVKNVLIAIDADYDRLLGGLIIDPRVLYTYGYSRENDMCLPRSLEQVFYHFCPVCESDIDVSEELWLYLESFRQATKWASVADAMGMSISVPVLDRQKPRKYLDSNTYSAMPAICRKRLLADVRKAALTPDRERVNAASIAQMQIPLHSFGHLLEVFCFQTITYLHSKYSNTQKITKDAFLSAAITGFHDLLKSNPEAAVTLYYSAVLSKV